MKKGFYILLLFCITFLSAQVNTVKSVYFELDKFELSKTETQRMFCLLDSSLITKAKALYLYGYCDDRGSCDYNDRLSKKRVDFVQNLIISKGIATDKIFISEGRGRVDINRDSVKNLEEMRDNNRRVDLIFVKNVFYTSFPKKPEIGDNIVLKAVTFDMGSSELSLNAHRELDKTISILKNYKTLRFEIRGHVCCTSIKYIDGIDKNTENRSLSENRAKNVYLYLRSKGINPYRMSFKGYGNLFPLGLDEAQDRRVELYVTKI